MDKLNSILKVAGLSIEEAQIYLYLLQNYNCTVLTISQSISIPRTTVYLHINSMLQKQVIKEKLVDGKKLLIPSSPDEILAIILKKRAELTDAALKLKQILPELQSAFNFFHEKPCIEQYNNHDDIYKILDKGLESNYVYIFDTSTKACVFLKKFYEKLSFSHTQSKELYIENPQSVLRKKTALSRNSVTFLPGTNYSETCSLIFDKFFVNLVFKNEGLEALVYRDYQIIEAEIAKFLIIWR